MTGQIYHAWLIQNGDWVRKPLGQHRDADEALKAARELWGWQAVCVKEVGRAVA